MDWNQSHYRYQWQSTLSAAVHYYILSMQKGHNSFRGLQIKNALVEQTSLYISMYFYISLVIVLYVSTETNIWNRVIYFWMLLCSMN
jgi:hypothetical protein